MKKFFLALTPIITLSLVLLPWSFLVAQTTTDAVTNVTADDSAVTDAGALTATITSPADNHQAPVGQTITFNGTAAGGEPPYVFHWDFGDGTTFNGQARQHRYSAAGTKTVTVTATDFSGAAASHSITLKINDTVPPPPPPPSTTLTISNIRVTDITTASAIVRWTTNNPATSRVIYDTISHPNLDSQIAPNFGYASSTVTADVDAKVTDHAVTVNNLLPDTNYYFRVISQ